MRMSEPPKKAFNAETLLMNESDESRCSVVNSPTTPHQQPSPQVFKPYPYPGARVSHSPHMIWEPIQNIFQRVNCPGSPQDFATLSQGRCRDRCSEPNARCSDALGVGLYRYQTALSLCCQLDESVGEHRPDGWVWRSLLSRVWLRGHCRTWYRTAKAGTELS